MNEKRFPSNLLPWNYNRKVTVLRERDRESERKKDIFERKKAYKTKKKTEREKVKSIQSSIKKEIQNAWVSIGMELYKSNRAQVGVG